jgi:D-alanyl-D-alanine carboxypeptidase
MWRLFFVFILIIPGILPAHAQSSTNPALDLLWSQIYAQPRDFSVACTPLYDLSDMVTYQPNESFPLASVSKLLIFIEYARRLDRGDISLDEQVEVAALEQYNIPRSNAGAHEQFMDLYPRNTTSISLWDVASTGMIQYSSNAATDYLLQRLSPVNWEELYALLHLTQTEYPHSMGAIALMMDNHETGQPTESQLQFFSLERGETLFERYLHDPLWHQDEITYRTQEYHPFPNWRIEAEILQNFTATGTVYDFLTILTAIYSAEGPLPGSVMLMTRDALRWQYYETLDDRYYEYASKLGFYSGGTLTLVAYGYPINGTPVISAAFFRNIPYAVYNEMRDQDSIGELAHWMNFSQCAELRDRMRSIPNL